MTTTYSGKHVRHNPHSRERSSAKCEVWDGKSIQYNCHLPFCPRHNAENYATHMARHATDSI